LRVDCDDFVPVVDADGVGDVRVERIVDEAVHQAAKSADMSHVRRRRRENSPRLADVALSDDQDFEAGDGLLLLVGLSAEFVHPLAHLGPPPVFGTKVKIRRKHARRTISESKTNEINREHNQNSQMAQ